MESTTTKRVSVLVGDIQPLDAGLIEKVCNYLDRIQDSITTKPEPRHIRFLTARRPRISNTQAQVISSSFVTGPIEEPALPRWIRDSVVLWDRELIEAEILAGSDLAMQGANPRSISPSRNVCR